MRLITAETPVESMRQGILVKTSSVIPYIPCKRKKVKTTFQSKNHSGCDFKNGPTLSDVVIGKTMFLFRIIALQSEAQQRPIAHEVQPFKRIISYALLTTSLWTDAKSLGS